MRDTMPESGEYFGSSIAVFIRDSLIAAGKEGVVCADLFKEVREHGSEWGLVRRKGTYNSFVRYFHWLKQLDWVKKTGVTEPAYQRGVETDGVLHERVRFTITLKGRNAPLEEWQNPQLVVHPNQPKYYQPTGRPRGRPRSGNA